MTDRPRKRIVGIFRIGDVSLKLLAFGEGPPFKMMAQLEKIVDPAILKEAPALAYTFTPTDISAIRKLAQEAEDAFFNSQSILARLVPAPQPPKENDPDGGTNQNKEEE